MNFQLSFTPATVTKFLIRVVLFLVFMSVFTHLMAHFLPDRPFIDFFARAFNVDFENNIPTTYSVMALLFSSLLLSVIAYEKNLKKDRYKYHWTILVGIFFFLTLDEAYQLHEQLITPMRSLIGGTGFLYYTWVVPFAFMVGLFLLSYSKFVFRLPASTRKWLILACILYVGGAIGMEMVGGYLRSPGIPSILYRIAVTVEELLEMLGIVVFIHALMLYVNQNLGEVSWKCCLAKAAENWMPDDNASETVKETA
jgi:hypothetical protein